MNYFVVAPDGQKYGPADIVTLNAWIIDGRLHPTSLMEQEGTGRRFAASTLPGLNFTAGMVPPVGVAYPRYGNTPPSAPFVKAAPENGKILMSFGLAVGAIVVAVFIGFLSFFLAIWGIQTAWAAKEEGHPAGWYAVAFNIIAILAVVLIRFGFRSMRVI